MDDAVTVVMQLFDSAGCRLTAAPPPDPFLQPAADALVNSRWMN